MPRYYKDRIYGEHERKGVGAMVRRKMVRKQLADMAAVGDLYFLNLAIAHRGAFDRMDYDSCKNDRL